MASIDDAADESAARMEAGIDASPPSFDDAAPSENSGPTEYPTAYDIGFDDAAQAQEQDYSLLTPQQTQENSRGKSKRTPSAVEVSLQNGDGFSFGATDAMDEENPFDRANEYQKVRINGVHVASSILPPDDPSLRLPEPNFRLGGTSATTARVGDDGSHLQFGLVGVYAALVGAQALWSGFHLFAKIAFDYMPPLVLPFIRSWGTAPILFGICYRQNKDFWRVDRRDLMQLALLGFLLCACLDLFSIGLMLTSAADGGITQPAMPVFAALMAIMLKRESASYIKFGGIICAIVGTVCIVVGESYLIPASEQDQQSSLAGGANGGSATAEANSNVTPGKRLAGIGCFMLQTFLFAVYLLIQKPLLARVPTITMNFYVFLFAIPWATIVAGYWTTQMDWSTLPPMWFVSILYTILMASVCGFLLYSYATKHLPASTASMGVTLQPLFSSLLGSIFLGEILTYMHVLGGLFLIAGMGLVVYSRVRESRKAADRVRREQLLKEATAEEDAEALVQMNANDAASPDPAL